VPDFNKKEPDALLNELREAKEAYASDNSEKNKLRLLVAKEDLQTWRRRNRSPGVDILSENDANPVIRDVSHQILGNSEADVASLSGEDH
jgi:hypothetical protein